MIMDDARYTREYESMFAMRRAAFSKKEKTLSTRRLDLNLRKGLVKCCIWSIALYDAGTRTFCKVH
jgi:hypothetical protein